MDSKFGLRTTFSFPTKSGIAGVILAAMGKGGEERKFLESFSHWKETAYSFVSETDVSLATDFHMIGSGYDSKDDWQKMMIPKKRDGGTPSSADGSAGGAKLTYRQYLQDAFFGVVMEVPSSYYDIGEIAEALQTPVWPLYLGRRCCVPSYPIYQGEFDSSEAAEEKILGIAKDKGLVLKETMLEGAEPEKGEVACLDDVPVTFGREKSYKSRRVTVVKA